VSEDSDVLPLRISVLSPSQAAAGAVLSRSHADYPSFRHLFPDPERRARALVAMFTGIARDAARLGSAYRSSAAECDFSRSPERVGPQSTLS
jgi:hypothetical protein